MSFWLLIILCYELCFVLLRSASFCPTEGVHLSDTLHVFPLLLASVKPLLSYAGICCCVCFVAPHTDFIGSRRGRVTVAGKEEVTTVFGQHTHEWSISGSELCRHWASRNNYCTSLEWLPPPRSCVFSLMSFLCFFYKSVVSFKPKVKFQEKKDIESNYAHKGCSFSVVSFFFF